MDPAALTALSAILGSAVGGSATIATAWLTQRSQGRRESVDAEIRKRENLYVEFIAESSKLLIDGLDHQLDSPEPLIRIYALLNRIRLVSSDKVLASADLAVTHIVERYLSPNLSREEMGKLLLTHRNDALKNFGEACRHELRTLQRRP